ncbi:hypothetical protein CK203_002388 [Vitis vinifera]|uniref:Uncharacterized protein n=1 Tax=Vitis vinifera TaxID=29760 RepID=A0A438KHX6_VITVI|nr:hypothetical protein CK203_002388 [Vitis vinifera]
MANKRSQDPISISPINTLRASPVRDSMMNLHSHPPSHLRRWSVSSPLSEDIRPGDHPLHQGQALHIPRSQLVALLQRKPESQLQDRAIRALVAYYRVSDSFWDDSGGRYQRPMVTQPPIEVIWIVGLDHSTLSYVLTERLSNTSRAQRFIPLTSEVPFGAPDDSKGFLLSPSSIRLLSVYDYASRPDPTVIHFTIDGRHGDIHTLVSFEEGASTQHVSFGCTPTPQHISTSAYGAEEGSYIEALFRISEGFYFGPHHLIMTALFTLKKGPQEEATESRCHSTTIPEPGAPAGPEHPEIPQPEEPQQAEIPTRS